MNRDTNTEATFCFIDIAGYTALTDSHGELAAADLVEDFCKLIDKAVNPSGKMHELIGDCAFVVFPDPLSAADALFVLFALIADRQNFPIVRAGLHHGLVLFRHNRYFGSTINLASRVTAQAVGGQILCTEQIAERLVEAGRGDQVRIFQRMAKLRHLPDAVNLYEMNSSSFSRTYAIDPVCKMQVEKEQAAGELRFNNKQYWFCSLLCVERFAKCPSSYIQHGDE